MNKSANESSGFAGDNRTVTRYSIHAKPGSTKGPLVEAGDDGTLTVFLATRAVDGAANEALIGLLAEYFRVRKSEVTLVRGHASRHKIVDIAD
jgi:uncharacterized protein YggU (UPF0235/DUF167 family)